jgi:hypothetical protein
MLQEEEVEVILRLLKEEVHVLFKGLQLGQSHLEVSGNRGQGSLKTCGQGHLEVIGGRGQGFRRSFEVKYKVLWRNEEAEVKII